MAFPSAIMVDADAKMSCVIYIPIPKGSYGICKSANKQTIRLKLLTVQTGFTDSLVHPTFLYDTLSGSAGPAALSACGVLFCRAVLCTHQQLKRHIIIQVITSIRLHNYMAFKWQPIGQFSATLVAFVTGWAGGPTGWTEWSFPVANQRHDAFSVSDQEQLSKRQWIPLTNMSAIRNIQYKNIPELILDNQQHFFDDIFQSGAQYNINSFQIYNNLQYIISSSVKISNIVT